MNFIFIANIQVRLTSLVKPTLDENKFYGVCMGTGPIKGEALLAEKAVSQVLGGVISISIPDNCKFV